MDYGSTVDKAYRRREARRRGRLPRKKRPPTSPVDELADRRSGTPECSRRAARHAADTCPVSVDSVSPAADDDDAVRRTDSRPIIPPSCRIVQPSLPHSLVKRSVLSLQRRCTHVAVELAQSLYPIICSRRRRHYPTVNRCHCRFVAPGAFPASFLLDAIFAESLYLRHTRVFQNYSISYKVAKCLSYTG